MLADVIVRGIVRSGSTSLAILEGPNKQSFVTRVKDRLLDATIVSIDADGVVFSEQVEGSRATTQVRKSLATGRRGNPMTKMRIMGSRGRTRRGDDTGGCRGGATNGDPRRHSAQALRAFSASPIDVDYQSANLRTVLRQLAEIGGVNLIVDPSVPVDATVDLKLIQVPWYQVMDMVIRSGSTHPRTRRERVARPDPGGAQRPN